MASLNISRLFNQSNEGALANLGALSRSYVPPTVPAQPEGSDVSAPIQDTELVAYERTCQAIGFEPAALLEARVLAFMAQKKIKRFDAAKVDAFMTAKARQKNVNTFWYWRPLREVDVGALSRSTQDLMAGLILNQWSATTATTPRDEPYQLAVPLRVLARVEQFLQAFGDKVKFVVTDYAEKRPDPFIGVVPKGATEPIIFDVWDEPDFK